MNFYPFHLGDYASHTKYLTLLEDLAYRRLIDLYYLSEAPLPLDAAEVSRKIGMREYLAEVTTILSDYFVKSENGYTNTRCDAEIAAYKAKADRAKSANKSRWGSEKSNSCLKSDIDSDSNSDTSSDADRIPTNNQEPITNNHKTNKKKTTSQPDKPSDISDKVWSDYLQIRKAKRSPITDTALAQIRREAEKAGIDLQTALEHCCTRGWQSFKAEWLGDKKASTQPANEFEGAL